MSLFRDMHERGVWRGYERHILRLNPVLERMAERGMPIEPIRFGEVIARLKSDFDGAKAKMNELVPIDAKQLKQYKKVPKKRIEECFQRDGIWFRPLAWSPSNKGLLRYVKYKKHPVPTNFKTDKETTNAAEVARLFRKTGDPVYESVLRYRKSQTILKNHIKNWQPGADGRVHTTFYFDPGTGQLSSRRPNIQNAPKHDDLEFGFEYAKLFRSMVAARPGHSICEFDYRAFHVITLAFEAQDADLMRVGRLDIHSFLTSHLLHLKPADTMFAMPDDELRDYLGWVKKAHKFYRDAKAKHALLGYNNGMGYRKLYFQYKEAFESMSEAKRVIGALDGLFPKAKLYREAICQKAHDQGFLVSRHGYIRFFWEVLRWQGGSWSHGDDHEAALCFYTQNDAHGEIKDRILTIAERGLDERYGMLNTIHDSLIFECHNDLVDEASHIIKEIMQAPSLVLIDPIVAPNGLSVEVEAVGGPDWSVMRPI